MQLPLFHLIFLPQAEPKGERIQILDIFLLNGKLGLQDLQFFPAEQQDRVLHTDTPQHRFMKAFYCKQEGRIGQVFRSFLGKERTFRGDRIFAMPLQKKNKNLIF